MKKFLFAFSILFFVACSDSETTDDLQAQITELEQTIDSLQATINSLTSRLTTAEQDNTALGTRLTEAERLLTEARNTINSLNSGLTSTQSSLTGAINANADAQNTIADLQRRLQLALAAVQNTNYAEAVNLGATGTVAEQTPSQAKQTIYGRWDIPSASKGGATCSFDFFEFNDENYLLSINTPEGTAQVFGEYIINEAADGTVENVQLLYNDNGNVDAIATLTDIVVTEVSSDTFNVTFVINLELPAALEVCQPALEGNVTAGKDDPVDEAETAQALSNHAKLIGEWEVIRLTDNGEDIYEENLAYFCIDDDSWTYDEETGQESYTLIDGCVPPVKYVINFSDYGTYMLAALRADGSAAEVQVNEWYWEDDDQTILVILFEDEEDGETDSDPHDVIELTFDDFHLQYTDTEFEMEYDENGNIINETLIRTVTDIFLSKR